jgi:hypothetical protein
MRLRPRGRVTLAIRATPTPTNSGQRRDRAQRNVPPCVNARRPTAGTALQDGDVPCGGRSRLPGADHDEHPRLELRRCRRRRQLHRRLRKRRIGRLSKDLRLPGSTQQHWAGTGESSPPACSSATRRTPRAQTWPCLRTCPKVAARRACPGGSAGDEPGEVTLAGFESGGPGVRCQRAKGRGRDRYQSP